MRNAQKEMINKGRQNLETQTSACLSQDERDRIAEELHILQHVKAAIIKEKSQTSNELAAIKQRYDQLKEESQQAIKSDLPALLEQMENQVHLASRVRSAPLPEERCPYFAHVVLKEKNKRKHVLIGHTPFLSRYSDYPVVDWRNAPVARLFFQHREGEEYEEELPGRIAEGVVERRHVLSIKDGQLCQIQTPQGRYVPDASAAGDGQVDTVRWEKLAQTGAFFTAVDEQSKAVSPGRHSGKVRFGAGQTGWAQPEVLALLDADQYGVLMDSGTEPILIVGGAGSGKTTVALHRVVLLCQQHPKRFHSKSVGVIVPEKGLVRLSENILASLGMREARVSTYDHWLIKEGQRMFTQVPKRLNMDPTAPVLTYKRSPAYAYALTLHLEEILAELWAKVQANGFLQDEPKPRVFAHFRPPSGSASGNASDSAQPKGSLGRGEYVEAILSRWQRKIEKEARRKQAPKRVMIAVDQLMRDMRSRLADYAELRYQILSNEALLGASVRAFGLEERLVESVLKHSRKQLAQRSEDELRGVDHERRTTLDGLDLDTATPDDLAQTLDVEDYTWLLYYTYTMHGALEVGRQKVRGFAHLVIDESQELAPVERFVLGKSVYSSQANDLPCVTLAGDELQSTDPSAHFTSWDQALRDLDISGLTRSRLRTNYRSTQEVADIAYEVLGSMAPEHKPVAARRGAPIRWSRFADFGHAVIGLVDDLTLLSEREPFASICVVARDEDSAKRYYHALDNLPDARLVLDGQFSFRSGIDVTTVTEVKGLEFDYVVIPDADHHLYGDDPMSRRALHVAMTRSIHQLWLVAGPQPTRLLRHHFDEQAP